MDRRIRELERRSHAGDEDAAARLEHERARTRRASRPPAGLTLVVGGRGSGKTIFLQYLERQGRKKGCLFVVWDRLGYWSPREGRHVSRAATAEEAAREAIKMAPCTLVVDEAHLAFPTHGPPRDSALWEIVYVGRNASAVGPWRRRGAVSVIAATQRPAAVWSGLRGLLDVAYVGRFPRGASKGDLDWIGALSEGAAERCYDLELGEFIPVELT